MLDLKNILSSVAPNIATALGGPFAGAAVKFLSDKFLGKSNATPDEIAQAVAAATPEQSIKLIELDRQYLIEMGKQDVDLYKTEVDDRKNAREREEEIAKTGKFDYMPPFIVVTIFIGFFAIVFIILNEANGIPQSSKDVIYMIIGLLGAKISSIVDYFFGSSSSSRKKDDVINKMK